LNPNITAKVFSVLLAVGSEYLNFQKNIEAQNSFYVTYYYEKMPSQQQFLMDLYKVTSVYSPLPNPIARSVAVFDLDDTIISPELELFYDNILIDLELFREIFDYIVLWTHGTANYLQSRMRSIDFKFDLLMARKDDIDLPPALNKGLAAVLRELNNKYNVQCIKYSLLVDDKLSNYNQDYDCMLHIDSQPRDGFYRSAYSAVRKKFVDGSKTKMILASKIQKRI
jgi:hypothetical protein